MIDCDEIWYFHEGCGMKITMILDGKKVSSELLAEYKKKIDLFEQYKPEIFEKLSNMFEDIESDITYR